MLEHRRGHTHHLVEEQESHQSTGQSSPPRLRSAAAPAKRVRSQTIRIAGNVIPFRAAKETRTDLSTSSTVAFKKVGFNSEVNQHTRLPSKTRSTLTRMMDTTEHEELTVQYRTCLQIFPFKNKLFMTEQVPEKRSYASISSFILVSGDALRRNNPDKFNGDFELG